MLYHMDEILWVGLFLLTIFISIDGKRCMRNDDIGWREGNIYFCDNPDLPECCEIDRQFKCCEPPPMKTFREQLQLWGTVVIFVLGLGILYLYYFRRDHGCCTSDTLSESFRSLRGKFTSRKGFHSVNEQYKEANEPKVKLTSSEMCNNGANWQFRKTPSF